VVWVIVKGFVESLLVWPFCIKVGVMFGSVLGIGGFIVFEGTLFGDVNWL